VSASVTALPVIVVSDTGPLPSSGGALETSLLEQNIPGLGSVEVCHAATIGQGDTSYSDASLGKLSLFAGGNVISADAAFSWALADCCDTVSISGAANVAGLMVNGQAIVVSGQPNQTVALPGGRIIINEQQTLLTANYGEITVNALHIVVDGIADIVISSSHADVLCGTTLGGVPPPPPPSPPPSECGDFVTGGGWITGTPSGDKANFGVAGGIKNGAFWGHLNYIDHGTGMHVKATAVTGYEIDATDADCRIITYDVTIDGASGAARVRVCDKGEPGRDDIFDIALSNGYHAGGDLGGSRPGGGNIQLHKCH
jgi:hypothetical protein